LSQLLPVQISAKHKVIVTPSDPRIPNLFPHQKTLPDGRHALPHGADEVRVLRNLGYAVPSPIMIDYDWGGTTPFRAQVVTTAMLVVEPKAFVLSGMGTGKSRSVLFAYDFLRQRRQARKMLIVAPLSTLNFTWVREVFEVFPQYRVGVLHGPKDKRLKVLAQDFDIYVINHDGLGVIEKELQEKFSSNDILCIDEVASFRNSRSKKHKIASRIAKTFHRVWGLTGTPTPREPTDAYGIIKLINPGAPGVPKAFTHFRDELMTKHGPFRWAARPKAQEKVFNYMQPSVRFTLEDCMDMPPTIHQNYEAPLSPQQTKIYKELKNHCRSLAVAGSITAANEGVVLNKLLQVSTGAVFRDDHSSVVLDCKPRLKVLKELIEENDRSIIVFAPFVPLVRMIHDELVKDGISTSMVHGGVSQKERTNIFNMFQNAPGKRVIVAHPATMAHGLTLTAANMIIWYGPVWDLEIFEQANARIARPGQSADRVLINYIIGTPVEKRVYHKLRNKEKMQGTLLEMFE